MDKKSQIVVTVHANVTIAEFPDECNICVKVGVAIGGEWKIASGDHTCLSAFSFRGVDHQINIDLPFETAFKSTSPFMWPRYVFQVFSQDASGNDCLKGYGCLFVPTTPGRHTVRVYCYIPEPSSMIQRFTAKLRGLSAELVNPLMPAFSDGRYSLRVSTKGYIDVELNVNVKSSDGGVQFSPAGTDEKTEKVAQEMIGISNTATDLANLNQVSEP